MKVSIWQQFASNHSSFFSVVGAFQTVEEAYHTAEIMRTILLQIAAWRAQQSWSYDYDPTPIEKAFSQQYEVEWPMALDWLNGDVDNAQQDITKALTVVDQLIFVDNPYQTHMGIQPFEGLLRYFGAATAGFDKASIEEFVQYPPTWFTITLTCVAPDAATAAALHTAWPEHYRVYEGTIVQEGNILRAEQMWLPIGAAFRDLLHDLEQRGCTDIHYTLEQKMLNEETAQ